MNRPNFRSLLVKTVLVSILCVVASGVGYHFGQRSREPQIAFLREQSAAWQLVIDSNDIADKVGDAWKHDMPIAEFEKKFGPIRQAATAELSKRDQDKTHVFTDQKTGRVFLLRFDDGKLASYHSGYGLGQAQQQVRATEK